MSPLQTWRAFLSRSLATRLDPEDFDSYVRILSTQQPLPSPLVAEVFLAPTTSNTICIDPLIPRYLQVLITRDLVGVADVLQSLWKWSSFRSLDGTAANGGAKQGENGRGKGAAKDDGKRWMNSYGAEETLFYRLTKYISSGTSPRNLQEAVELVLVCTTWMESVITAGDVANEMMGWGHMDEMTAQNMGLGTLVVAVVENDLVQKALGKGTVPKEERKALSKSLANFVPLLQGSPLSASRLDDFRMGTLVRIEPVDKKERAADQEIEDILDEGMVLGIESLVVADLPIVNSRAGLYVYLNSLVCSRLLWHQHHLFLTEES